MQRSLIVCHDSSNEGKTFIGKKLELKNNTKYLPLNAASVFYDRLIGNRTEEG